MIDLIKKLFHSDPPVNYSQLVKEGALIVDVRSKGEYGSVNIPVDQLSQQLNRLPKDKVIITCCASGMRSATARGILQSKGYPKVHNGGGWGSLQSKL
jgi:phage shock protein E